jgi:drug/metabolite transporter (DMT)-like permease
LAAGLELPDGGGILPIARGVWWTPHLAISGRVLKVLTWLVLAAIGRFTAYGFLAKRVSSCVSTTFAYLSPVVEVSLD